MWWSKSHWPVWELPVSGAGLCYMWSGLTGLPGWSRARYFLTWGYSSSLSTVLYCVPIQKNWSWVLKKLPFLPFACMFTWWGMMNKSIPFFPNPSNLFFIHILTQITTKHHNRLMIFYFLLLCYFIDFPVNNNHKLRLLLPVAEELLGSVMVVVKDWNCRGFFWFRGVAPLRGFT